jgi:hypothetical protein
VFVITVPVPLVIPLWARVPAARILMLGAISTVTMLVETTRGSVVALAILLLLQGVLAMAVLWFVAYALSLLLARLSPGMGSIITVAVVVLLIAVTTVGSFYSDPYRPETLHSNLIQVYE